MPPISSRRSSYRAESKDNTEPYPVERDGPALRVALEEEKCRSRDASEKTAHQWSFSMKKWPKWPIATAMIAAVFSQSVLSTGGVLVETGDLMHLVITLILPGAARMDGASWPFRQYRRKQA